MLTFLAPRHSWLVPLILCLPLAASAQDKPLPVGVINLDKVFKEYARHKERLQPLIASAKEFDEAVQLRQVEIETTLNQLRKHMPGTPDFVRLQQQMAKLQAELPVFAATEQKKLQKRQAAILIATQNEVVEQITKISRARGLKLVLRQYDPPTENKELPEIERSLNREVLFQDGLDITEEVLKALNEPTASES